MLIMNCVSCYSKKKGKNKYSCDSSDICFGFGVPEDLTKSKVFHIYQHLMFLFFQEHFGSGITLCFVAINIFLDVFTNQ